MASGKPGRRGVSGRRGEAELDTVKAVGAKNASVQTVRDLYSGFFRLEEAVVTHPRFDGGEQTITRLSLERGDSVAVVLVDSRQRLVWLTEHATAKQ